MKLFLFLIDTAFFLATLLLVLRFLLQMVRADYRVPLTHAIITMTNPVLTPMRKVIPGFGKQDWAAAILAWLLAFAKMFLMFALSTGFIAVANHPVPVADAGIVNLVLLASIDLLAIVVNLFLLVIVVQVVISWVAPGVYNPNIIVLQSLSAPLLRPIQRRLPQASGLDFSPMVASLILVILRFFLLPHLANIAAYL